MPNLKTTGLRNPYNTFRDVGSPFIEYTDSIRKFERTFDEPTYLTFRMEFNAVDMDNDLVNTNFDRIPQPLFSTAMNPDLAAREHYSSLQYLWDSNEMMRVDMLQEFINKWGQLQNEYQWYFQSVSGLNTLMNVVPGRGKRVANDARLTLNMLEGIDQKVTYLLNLYRKVAWDDVYQRWVLPDMMRYFRLRIYVTEFRSFHRSNFLPNNEINPDTGETFTKGPEESEPMILSIINNMVPTYILDLERCEFDLETFNVLPDSLTVQEPQMREVEFGIKVGNFTERYINPIMNYYWYDLLVNGFGRTQQQGETTTLSKSTEAGSANAEGIKAQGNLLATQSHQSGQPFVQTGNIDNIHNSNPNYSEDVNSVNPIDPATWIGNALTVGKALVKNLVEDKVDELKTMKIPGLGISFNEAVAAIQSKNVFTLFGAARKALSESIEGTLPSQELERNMVDTQFRDFLQGISESEATTPEGIELQTAANIVLNDEGRWEEIKDYSLATDLIAETLGEINSLNQIENSNVLKAQYNQQEYIPVDIKDGIAFEGLPTSTATGAKLEGQKLQQPIPGQATISENVQAESIQSADTGSTDGTLPAGFQRPASLELGADAGESLGQPEDGLGEDATGGFERPIPSEQLGSEIGGGYDIPAPSSELGTDAGAGKDLPEAGEATDGDELEAKPLPIPNPSQATNNDLNK